jgi:hypothetical protein
MSVAVSRSDVLDDGEFVKVEFRPSLKDATMMSAIVSILLVLTMPPLAYFLIGVRPAWLAFAFGVATGFVAFAYYFGRHVRKAPKLVRVAKDGFAVVGRGEETTCAWNDVRQAFHESAWGLCWRFELLSGNIVLRDDGFTATQWDELSKAMSARLKQHGILVETQGWTAAFADEDEDE